MTQNFSAPGSPLERPCRRGAQRISDDEGGYRASTKGIRSLRLAAALASGISSYRRQSVLRPICPFQIREDSETGTWRSTDPRNSRRPSYAKLARSHFEFGTHICHRTNGKTFGIT